MARLEIRDPVVKALFFRNSGTCAFDNCVVECVTFDNGSSEPSVNVEMAHIIGPEPKSPRPPDGSMSDEVLRDFDNLLLLCPNHHRNYVDKNWPNEFTVDRLRSMKLASEESPSETDLPADSVNSVQDDYRAYHMQIVDTQKAEVINNAQSISSGVEPSELIEIMETQNRLAIANFTAGAEAEAARRIEAFEKGALSAFENPTLQDAFREPSFHRSVRRAQEAAACADDEEQIEVLVGLLAERAEPGANTSTRIAIDRAYAVVSEASPLSVDMLTATFLAQSTIHRPVDLAQFALIKAQLVAPFLQKVPQSRQWVDEMIMLGGVVHSGIGLKNLEVLWRELNPGVVASSFPNDQTLGTSTVTPEQLGSGILAATGNDFALTIGPKQMIEQAVQDAGHEDCDAIVQALCSKPDPAKVTALDGAIENNAVLKSLRDMYNALPGLQVTPIGRAVVYANLKRRGVHPRTIGIGKLSDLM